MKAIALTIWLVAVSSDNSAERMESLERYLELPEDKRAISYPLTRCSGLFVALLRMGGEAMPPGVESQLWAWAMGLMKEAADNITIEEGLNGSDAMDASISRSDALSRSYLSAFEAIVGEGGNMSNSSDLVPRDLRTCKQMVVEMDLKH